MRIVHVSTRLILGGSQENTVLSCEGQAGRGHEVHLAFGPIYGPEGSHLRRVEGFRTADGRGITTHVVPHLVREIDPLADWRCWRELAALVRELRPDIVHTHSSKAGILGRAAVWREVRRGVRCGVVHTVHGPPFMPVMGGMGKRARVRVLNWMYTAAERYAARRCHVIVSVADAMTREFLSRGIGRAGQYVTVHSGMETARFLHAQPGEDRASVRRGLGLRDDDFVVGTVARLAEHKGHDDLLDALGEELKRRAGWKMLWVGDGWWRERLIARARGMGLGVAEVGAGGGMDEGAEIVITGLVPPERVAGMMRAMDVLAHPSYREGLPRTVPQALLCGVCPVAYDVDGTGEVVRDGETGVLVGVGDIEGLRRAIVGLAEDEGRRAAMAARGRAVCAEMFDAGRMVESLEGVYARAMAMAGG